MSSAVSWSPLSVPLFESEVSLTPGVALGKTGSVSNIYYGMDCVCLDRWYYQGHLDFVEEGRWGPL